MFKVDQSDQILRTILDAQQQFGRMKSGLDRMEEELWYGAGQEQEITSDASEQLQEVARTLDQVKKLASEVNDKVLPLVQKRIMAEMAILEANRKTLQGRVEALSGISTVRLEVNALMNQVYQCEASELPDLSKRIITLMEQKPQIPIQLFSELCRSR